MNPRSRVFATVILVNYAVLGGISAMPSGLLSGAVADLLGLDAATHLAAVLTFASGVVVAVAMRNPRPFGSS